MRGGGLRENVESIQRDEELSVQARYRESTRETEIGKIDQRKTIRNSESGSETQAEKECLDKRQCKKMMFFNMKP